MKRMTFMALTVALWLVTVHPDLVYSQTVAPTVFDSLQIAETAVAVNPKNAPAYVRLGHVYLSLGKGEDAFKAFRKALNIDDDLAEAYNGLGLVHLNVRKDLHVAERYFRQALGKDRSFIEAQYNIAKAHLDAGNHSAKGEAERLVKMDATYAPAYLMLAQWHERRNKHSEALGYYKRYMDLQPDDQEVGYKVGLNLLSLGLYDQAEKFAMTLLNAGPRYGVLAQVLIHRGDYPRALQAFEFYINYLTPEEQDLYRDISLVASPEELAAYQALGQSDRREYINKFWLRHEPDLVSGGARRRAEHYRRVWYVMTHFGKTQKPWDQRGEIYIRYGEPDYRSTSADLNFEVPLAVQRVQEHRAAELYGSLAAGVRFYGPVFPIRTDKVAEVDYVEPVVEQDFTNFEVSPVPAGSVTADTLGLARYRPVTSGSYWGGVPWEAWIYTKIEGGVEVVFTDEMLSGRFDFAPIPRPTMEDFYRIRGDGQLSRMMLQFSRLAPEVVAQRTTSSLPERYDISQGVTPLDFLYDLASFAGDDGQTRVEVYTGISVGQFLEEGVQDTVLSLERTAALADSGLNRVYRARDLFRIRVATGEKGMVLDQTELELPPGPYEMGVQIRQEGADKAQTYRQRLAVSDFSKGGLQVSDVQVARQVIEDPAEGSRFVKGTLQVVPAPGRAFFVGQPVYLYFEIYGLEKDDFGAVQYHIMHTIRFKELGHVAVRALSRVGKLLGVGQGDQEVKIEYEQTGSETRLADYVALELGETGVGEYQVSVSVQDMKSKQTVVKEAFFRLVDKLTEP
jgi:GWxTD domain-containing protein